MFSVHSSRLLQSDEQSAWRSLFAIREVGPVTPDNWGRDRNLFLLRPALLELGELAQIVMFAPNNRTMPQEEV